MDNAQTHAFARRLAARRRPIWVRFVLVPGWSDDDANVAATAAFAASLGVVERVDVLPFHQMGRFKWKAPSIPYELETLESPSTESVERALSIFRKEGLNAL